MTQQRQKHVASERAQMVGIACGVIVDDEFVIEFAPRDRLRRCNAPQGNTIHCRAAPP